MKIKNLTLIVCLLAVLFGMSFQVSAQSAGGGNPEPPPPAYPKDLKTKILDVKFRDPAMLANVLRGLSSGAPYSQVQQNSEFKTITVRDFPENIATMEAALKRLDVLEDQPANLEVHIHVLVSSTSATEAATIPADLEPVVKQLQGTLKYPGYRYATTFVNRVRAGGGEIEGNGVGDSLFPFAAKSKYTTFYQYKLKDIRLVKDATEHSVIKIDRFNFGIRLPITLSSGDGSSPVQYSDVGFNTALSLREGEKVVVGTTNSNEGAIVVVVSVKQIQ